MKELLLHPTTREQLASFCAKPAHGLLVNAPLGSGKLQVAQYVASTLLKIESEKLQNYPYFLQIEPSGDSISIDTIRGLKSFTQLRTTGRESLRRIVIVEQAESLTDEAQNAFLKLLEEPPKDTVFILTTSQPRKLLPTISSRLQEIDLKRPTEEMITQHFKEQYSDDAIKRACYMSQGRIGLMRALLAEDSEHPLAQSVATAKEILQKTPYERLIMVNELGTADLPLLLTALYSVVHAALVIAIEKGNNQLVRRWYKACWHIEQAEVQLSSKPSAKLLLSDLFLNL